MAYKLTRLLEILGDGEWHETDEIRQMMDLSVSEVEEIADFLGKYNFAEVEETRKRLRINKDFRKILAQPV